jgi:Protein of unknown function (DUF2877)
MPGAAILSLGPLVGIDGLRGSVHAVFPSSIYIEAAGGPLLAVHGPGHGHTPTSLVAAGTPRDGWGVSAGDAVSGGFGHLRIGPALFDARQAGRWQAPTPTQSGVAATAALRLLPAIIMAASAPLDPACRALGAALLEGNSAAVDNTTAGLVGSGPGLTPAGDDAVVGLLAMLHRAGPPALCAGPLRLLGASIGARLAHTTSIGAHYLRLALLGHFGEHLTALVDVLGTGAAVDPAALARVRRSGASSGADTLAGVAAGLRLLHALSSTHRLEEAA